MIHYPDTLDHPLLAPYRDLQRSGLTRRQDWFIGEGRLVVERLLESEFETVSVVLGDQVADSFMARIPDAVDTLVLPRQLVSELVGFEFHSGIVACGRRARKTDLDLVEPNLRHRQATVVVCPYTVLAENLGSIVRLCSAFGVDALIVGPRSADPFARRVIRVSMGNIFRLPVVEPDSVQHTLGRLRSEFGFSLVAATGQASADPLPMPRPGGRIALVLGNEAEGIPAPLVQACDRQVSIPMSGTTDSLNVAHALAVLLYQFMRVSP